MLIVGGGVNGVGLLRELALQGVDTLLVSVVNAAPALDPIADQSVMAGQPLALTASFLDPGSVSYTHLQLPTISPV